ncbi:MAG: hypothetical protein ACOYOR_06580 [Flavobacterium psychrophilum]
MIELEDFLGFPARLNKEKGTVEFDSNCEFPNQSKECTKLFESIERLFIEDAQLKYPLNIKYWKAIIEPTEENIKQYYSQEGIILYMQKIKTQLIDTTTFFKLEVHYSQDKSLPNLILHFYEVNYKDTLNINDNYGFSDRCSVKYNTQILTPDRIINLKKNNISYEWIRYIPLFPIEVIKFEDDNIKKFNHQELNKSSFTDEIW